MFIKKIFLIIYCLFSLSSVNASGHREEIFEARQLNLKLSSKQYHDFKKIKKSYYGESVFKELNGSQRKIAHFYEIIRPDQTVIYLLGTAHDLPFDVLPESVRERIQHAPNIYVESEMIAYLAFFQASSQPLSGFSNEEEDAINTHLTPCLNLFHSGLKATNLKLEDIYSAFLGFDCLLGMDSEIIMLSLALGKPVLMLDDRIDLFETNLNLEKLMMEDDIKSLEDSKANDEEYQATLSKRDLLQNHRNVFLEKSIKENITEIENPDKIQDTIKSSMESYAQFDANDVDSIEKDADSGHYKVSIRNMRWDRILRTVPSQSVIGVGYGHIPDLFTIWQKEKCLIKKVRED